MRGFLYTYWALSVKKIAVKISGNRTAWKHERFTPDSYYMLGTQQRHKWPLTLADWRVNTCNTSCPFLSSRWWSILASLLCSFGFAGCFRRNQLPDLWRRESHSFTGDRKHVLVIKGNVTIMVGQEFTRKRPSRRPGPDWTGWLEYFLTRSRWEERTSLEAER